MLSLFTERSAYKKSARILAIAWTLLIFILCLIPGSSLPEVNIPFVDKWAHMILFGIFSLLLLCAYPSRDIRWLLAVFTITLFFGWLVEYIQGHYVPNRSQDNMDTLADAVGGIIGILLFTLLSFAGRNGNTARL